jgi:hypothetical protein
MDGHAVFDPGMGRVFHAKAGARHAQGTAGRSIQVAPPITNNAAYLFETAASQPHEQRSAA